MYTKRKQFQHGNYDLNIPSKIFTCVYLNESIELSAANEII